MSDGPMAGGMPPLYGRHSLGVHAAAIREVPAPSPLAATGAARAFVVERLWVPLAVVGSRGVYLAVVAVFVVVGLARLACRRIAPTVVPVVAAGAVAARFVRHRARAVVVVCGGIASLVIGGLLGGVGDQVTASLPGVHAISVVASHGGGSAHGGTASDARPAGGPIGSSSTHATSGTRTVSGTTGLSDTAGQTGATGSSTGRTAASGKAAPTAGGVPTSGNATTGHAPTSGPAPVTAGVPSGTASIPVPGGGSVTTPGSGSGGSGNSGSDAPVSSPPPTTPPATSPPPTTPPPTTPPPTTPPATTPPATTAPSGGSGGLAGLLGGLLGGLTPGG